MTALVGLGLLPAGCSCKTVTSGQSFGATLQEQDVSLGIWSSDTQTLTGTAIAPWNEALANSAAVAPGMGVITFDAPDPYRSLSLELPFPLAEGDSLPLSTAPASDVKLTFAMLPPGQGAAAWLDNCRTIPGVNCSVQNLEMVTGTLTVTSAAPLSLRIAANVTYGSDPSSPSDAVAGNIAFTVGPLQNSVETGCFD